MLAAMDDQPEPVCPVCDDTDCEFTPAEREMIAEGLADLAAGRLVPWEQVEAWIGGLGTAHELPPPYPR